MDTLTELFCHSAAQRIGWALIHFLWQGAAVAVMLAVALALLRNRSAQARWIASCAALALMVALPVATTMVVHVEPPAQSPSAPAEVAAADSTSPPAELPDEPAPIPLPHVADTHGALAASPQPLEASPPPAQPTEALQTEPVAAASWSRQLQDAIRPALPWAMLVWLTGVLAMSVWHFGGWLQVRRMRHCGTRPPGAVLQVAFGRLVQRLRIGRPVRLLESVRVSVPVVLGWVRPVILLPVGVLTGLTPQQLEAILAHELAHIRRWDCLVQAIQAVVETLLFYHPAVWWVSRQIRQQSEQCCDDLAVGICGDRRTYAHALAKVAELGAGRRVAAPAAATGGKLLPRIRRLLGADKPGKLSFGRCLSGALAMVAIVAIGIAVGVSCTSAGPQSDVQATSQPATQPATVNVNGPPWEVRLPNGAVVELVGLADSPSAGKDWWGPDGQPLAERPYIPQSVPFAGQTWADRRAIEVAYRVRVPDTSQEGATFLSVSENNGWSTVVPLNSRREPIYSIKAEAVLLPTGKEATDIRIGAAAGAWKPVARGTFDANGAVQDFKPVDAPGFIELMAPPEDAKEGAFFSAVMDSSWHDVNWRFVAHDDLGMAHRLHEGRVRDIREEGKPLRQRYDFIAEPPTKAKLVSLRLDVRRYHYAEFQNVTLLPGRKTDLRVVTGIRGEASATQPAGLNTELHSAAAGGHGEAVQRLVEQGQAVDVRDEHGRTPLHLAAAGGHGETAERLVKLGAAVDARDDAEQTPLHLAAAGGHRDVAERLLKLGSHINAVDSNGKTPLDLAIANGHQDMALFLRQRQPATQPVSSYQAERARLEVRMAQLSKEYLSAEANRDEAARQRLRLEAASVGLERSRLELRELEEMAAAGKAPAVAVEKASLRVKLEQEAVAGTEAQNKGDQAAVDLAKTRASKIRAEIESANLRWLETQSKQGEASLLDVETARLGVKLAELGVKMAEASAQGDRTAEDRIRQEAADIDLSIKELRLKAIQQAQEQPTSQPAAIRVESEEVELDISAASQATQPATQPADEWGKANNGVQARLRADKHTWATGQTPTFRADIRNQGKGEYTVAQAQQLCTLELDGTRYMWVGDMRVKSSALPPGRAYSDIPIALTDNWVKVKVTPEAGEQSGTEKLKLTPGKHSLRVIFFCQGVGGSQEDVVVESNAVEFGIAAPGVRVSELTFDALSFQGMGRPVRIATDWDSLGQEYISSRLQVDMGFAAMLDGHATFTGFIRDLHDDSVVLVASADLLNTPLADIPAGKKATIPRTAIVRIDEVVPTSQPATQPALSPGSGQATSGPSTQPAADGPVFGPVVEMTLELNTLEQAYADLDSGRILSYPENSPTDGTTEVTWWRQEGVDFHLSIWPEPDSKSLLYHIDLAAMSAPHGLWNAGPMAVAVAAKKADWPGGVGSVDRLPATLVFRTRQGNVGVMEIVEVITVTEVVFQKKKARIRYKLLKDPPKVTDEQVAWGEAVGGIQCAVRPVKEAFKLGEDIAVDVVYRNVSDQPITVCVCPDPFYIWTVLEVRAISGSGSVRGQHANGLQKTLDETHFATLKPSETASVRQIVRLPPKAILSPGQYMVRAALNTINRMEEHVPGYADFCQTRGLKPWNGVIESGIGFLTITEFTPSEAAEIAGSLRDPRAYDERTAGARLEQRLRTTTQPATQPAAVPADAPGWVKAAVAAMPDWEIERYDSKPSVTVSQRDGYRLVLRKGHKEYLNLQPRQQGGYSEEELAAAKFVMQYSHLEIVVFDGGELPAGGREETGWTEWEDEWPDFKKAVYMGQGMAMSWYARATIYDQERLREMLKLQGGDDRLALLTEALLVDDKGTWTRNSCVHLLAAAGDKAIPYIRAAVEKKEDGWKAIYALSFIQTDAATEYLKDLYRAETTRPAATYALIHQPFRQAAKEQYLDMIRQRTRIFEPAQACVEFGWKEAVALLDTVYLQPHSLGEFEAAFNAKRELEGKPVPEALRDAQQTLQGSAYLPEPLSQEALNRAKMTILANEDTEAATVIAIRLALFGAKASADRTQTVGKLGREILQQLPRKQTEEIVVRVAKSLGTVSSYEQTAVDLLSVLSEQREDHTVPSGVPSTPSGSPPSRPGER